MVITIYTCWSYFMWSGALDIQLWCSSITICNIFSISHNHHTDMYPQTPIYLYIYRDSQI